jgi:hypothetical protein
MFLLEVVGLIGIGRFGWQLGTSTPWSLSLSALLVACASAIWAIFRAPGFVPSGGEPIVAVPGPVRAAIEFMFYALGAWGLWASGWQVAAAVLVMGVIVVSVALRERLVGLLANRPPAPGK